MNQLAIQTVHVCMVLLKIKFHKSKEKERKYNCALNLPILPFCFIIIIIGLDSVFCDLEHSNKNLDCPKTAPPLPPLRCVTTSLMAVRISQQLPADPVLLCSLSSVPGGHVNPAVSLAMVILGKLKIWKFPFYVIAQFLGAFAGAAAVFGLYYGK